MTVLFLLCVFQLICWQNVAFLFHPQSKRRPADRFFDGKHAKIARQQEVRNQAIGLLISTEQKSTELASSIQEDFEIPLLNDDVQCGGGRDFVQHIKFLHESVLNLTGRGLYERMQVEIDDDSLDDDIYESICRNERYVLISHGKQDDPVYNFGNLACLQAFARSWKNLTSMPSRLCVVSKSQDEALRIELMHNVTNFGFVDGEYRGYRVRGDGKFIKLTECCVWNCYDNNGNYIGQAALFDRDLSPVVDSTDD